MRVIEANRKDGKYELKGTSAQGTIMLTIFLGVLALARFSFSFLLKGQLSTPTNIFIFSLLVVSVPTEVLFAQISRNLSLTSPQ